MESATAHWQGGVLSSVPATDAANGLGADEAADSVVLRDEGQQLSVSDDTH